MTNTQQKSGFAAPMSVALVLFSAHAGGGFATGNQANTYFVGLGWEGIVSLVLAMFLLTVTMAQAMKMYNRGQYSSYKELFRELYHPFGRMEILFELFFNIMVIMAIAAAVSGAASALAQYVSLHYGVSVVVVGSFVFLLTIFGARVIRVASTYTGIAILVTAIFIYVVGLLNEQDLVPSFLSEIRSSGAIDMPKAILKGFTYAGFQCVTLPTMLVVGKTLKSSDGPKRAMRFSFVINTIALALSVLMLMSWQSVYTGIERGSELPTLTIVREMGFEWLVVLYVICLLLCLVSTGVTTTFGFVSRFESTPILAKIQNTMTRRALVSAFIIVLSMGISGVGLTNIIKYGYGYCGYLAVAIVILPFITRPLRERYQAYRSTQQTPEVQADSNQRITANKE